MRREREYLALEVKATKHIASSHFSGLRAIANLKGLSRRLLVYRGTRKLKSEEGTDVYPIDTFLQALAENTLWTG